MSATQQPRWLSSMQDPALFDHPVEAFTLLETHISWVLLTGPYAYKIRKPVDLGFLDFTSLSLRFQDCLNELALNRRFSPELYCGLIKIGGTPRAPELAPVDIDQPLDPAALDYAVKMVQFPQQQLLSALVDEQLPEAELLSFCQQLAKQHDQAPNQPPSPELGRFDTVALVMRQNFEHTRPYLDSDELIDQWQRLSDLTEQQLHSHRSLLEQRHQQGCIRECHGDLHLHNLVLYQQRVLMFDGIEFNPRYRWIDPLNDLAFLLMDLHRHQQPQLANRLLNRYLEHSLDYPALPLLPLYMAYRAMVRAKVCLLSLGEPEEEIPPSALAQYQAYTALAEQFLAPKQAALVVMNGVSGSGKSWLSQQLVDHQPWIRLRSDRLRPYWHRQQSGQLARYSPEMSQKVYQNLQQLTARLLQAGFAVIADAAMLEQSQRQLFIALAEQFQLTPLLVSCQTDEAVLRARLEQRLSENNDPSEATLQVLQSQLDGQQPLTRFEQRWALKVDTGDADQVKQALLQAGQLTVHC